jgi:CubicO group peptidase (beta-lactamase class C family)
MGTLQYLDGYVEQVRQAWHVPGLAIAIVKDDRPALVKGYGVRDIAETASVDAQTRFAIASATKTFTATALGMLVDAGDICWDDPAVMHLPGLQLSEGWS